VAPADYQQGETVRIMYVHVPAAWMAMFVYSSIAIASATALIWKHPLADLIGKASAPVGAGFTLICLVTGSLWGKPMWGTAWVWDARLTSEFILLLLYLGYIALHATIKEQKRADRAASLLAILGIVNLPIIHYSVVWWNTLHQASTISKLDSPSIVGEMLWPLLLMIIGYMIFFIGVICRGGSAEVLMREKRSNWVKEV